MTNLIDFTEDDVKQITTFVNLNIKQGSQLWSKGEIDLLINRAQRLGLDPRDKTIFAIRRGGNISVDVGIDGLCQVAANTNEYAGIAPPVWDFGSNKPNPNGTTNPVSATATVYRIVQGRKCTFTATVYWAELRGDSPFWVKMPAHMLYKVALSQALRKAFPAQLAGTYTREEMPFVDDGYEDSETPQPAYIKAVQEAVDNPPAKEPVAQTQPAPQPVARSETQPVPQPVAPQPTSVAKPAPQAAPSFSDVADLGMRPISDSQKKVIRGLIMNNAPEGVSPKDFCDHVRATYFADVQAGPKAQEFVEALNQEQAEKLIENWAGWQKFYLAHHKSAEQPADTQEAPSDLTPEQAAPYRPDDPSSPNCFAIQDYMNRRARVQAFIMGYSDVEPKGDSDYTLITPQGQKNEQKVAQTRILNALREIHNWNEGEKFHQVANADEMELALNVLDAMEEPFITLSNEKEAGTQVRSLMNNMRVPQAELPAPLSA